MAIFFVIIISTLSIACEQPQYELYIDDACTANHRQAIKDGIKRVNEWVDKNTGEAPIEYMGTKNHNHDTAMSGDPHNTGRDTVVCFYDEPTQYSDIDELRLGDSGVNGGDVWLFLFRPSMQDIKIVRSVISHEIGHYVGIGAHSPDPSAVMSETRNEYLPIEYTESDTELLCEIRDCH